MPEKKDRNFGIIPGDDPTLFINSRKESYSEIHRKITELHAQRAGIENGHPFDDPSRLRFEYKVQIICELCSKGRLGLNTFRQKLSKAKGFNPGCYEDAYFEVIEELGIEL